MMAIDSTDAMPEIRMVDLQGQYMRIRTEIDNAVSRVISRADFIKGIEVAAFEKELADYIGTQHCITCGNGTDALTIALMAIGLKPGDEVVVPAFSFAAPAEAVAFLGGVPVFADCDSCSFNMSAESLRRCITSRTKAIIPVHLFGSPCDMNVIMAVADEYGIPVIEDNAQSLGAVCNMPDNTQKHAGTIGKIGCTSFFPSKVLGGFGDGGAMFTDDDMLAERMRRIANHGQPSKYDYREIGMNSRLDTVQAAILLVKLHYLDEYISMRRAAASRYTAALCDIKNLVLPSAPATGSHVWHQYTLIMEPCCRDGLKACLEAEGIPSAIYYSSPLYVQPAYRKICRCDAMMAAAGRLSKSVLSLPMHTELTLLQQSVITEVIRRFFDAASRHVSHYESV